jgi:hypothetical protein
MRTSKLILQQRLHSLRELQASATDLLFSGKFSKEELNHVLGMISQIQLEAVQVETGLNRTRHLHVAS